MDSKEGKERRSISCQKDQMVAIRRIPERVVITDGDGCEGKDKEMKLDIKKSQIEIHSLLGYERDFAYVAIVVEEVYGRVACMLLS